MFRHPGVSQLDPCRDYLLQRLQGPEPATNAEVLSDEIRVLGYEGGRSIRKEFLRPLP